MNARCELLPTVSYYLKKNSKTNFNDGLLYLRISMDGKRSDVNLKCRVFSGFWNNNKQKVSNNAGEDFALLTNYFLESSKNKIFNIARDLLQREIVFSSKLLKDIFIGKIDMSKLDHTGIVKKNNIRSFR